MTQEQIQQVCECVTENKGEGGGGRGAYVSIEESKCCLLCGKRSVIIFATIFPISSSLFLFLFLSLQIKDDIERFKSQGVEMEEKRKTILRGLEVKEEKREMRGGGVEGGRRSKIPNHIGNLQCVEMCLVIVQTLLCHPRLTWLPSTRRQLVLMPVIQLPSRSWASSSRVSSCEYIVQ